MSRPNRSLKCSRICSAVRTRVLTAASSIASGRPSSRRHRSTTEAWFEAVSSNVPKAAAALSVMNRNYYGRKLWTLAGQEAQPLSTCSAIPPIWALRALSRLTRMTEELPIRIAQVSPRFQARMAGVIGWITTTAGFAQIVRGRLVVDGDAAATAHNILANETLFRLAFAGEVIALLYVAYTLLLYRLFTPVNRSLSLLAAFFSLVGCAIGALNCGFHIAPLVVLGGAHSLSAFTVEQLQALALMFLKLHAQVYNISMVLFGSYNVLIGYLIFRSNFLPRILGVLLAISGFCYLINSFANFLSPAFAAHCCRTFWFP